VKSVALDRFSLGWRSNTGGSKGLFGEPVETTSILAFLLKGGV